MHPPKRYVETLTPVPSTVTLSEMRLCRCERGQMWFYSLRMGPNPMRLVFSEDSRSCRRAEECRVAPRQRLAGCRAALGAPGRPANHQELETLSGVGSPARVRGVLNFRTWNGTTLNHRFCVKPPSLCDPVTAAWENNRHVEFVLKRPRQCNNTLVVTLNFACFLSEYMLSGFRPLSLHHGDQQGHLKPRLWTE